MQEVTPGEMDIADVVERLEVPNADNRFELCGNSFIHSKGIPETFEAFVCLFVF